MWVIWQCPLATAGNKAGVAVGICVAVIQSINKHPIHFHNHPTWDHLESQPIQHSFLSTFMPISVPENRSDSSVWKWNSRDCHCRNRTKIFTQSVNSFWMCFLCWIESKINQTYLRWWFGQFIYRSIHWIEKRLLTEKIFLNGWETKMKSS
jgi:hypothetical protein